jgi:hypothetical protein
VTEIWKKFFFSRVPWASPQVVFKHFYAWKPSLYHGIAPRLLLSVVGDRSP